MQVVIDFFLRRTMLVNIMLVAIFGVCAMAITSTKRNTYPEVDLATMVVTTVYPGASPRDVEQNVTRLIEDELKGIPGIDNFTSVSGENVSSVVVEIDIDYPDPAEVKDEIRRAVDRVTDLPTEVDQRPQVRDLKSTEFPAITVGISGTADYAALRRVAKIVERDLKRIKGVSKIDRYAYRDREFQIDLEPAKLKQYYIALNDVLFALDTRNVRATGGNLESFRTQRNILTLSQFEDLIDVRNVIVRSGFSGGKVRVRDVARVRDGFTDEKMRTIFNGETGISLVVKKSANSDLINLIDRINTYLETKKKTLPKNVHLIAVNDGSLIVRNRLNVVLSNAVIGFFLVVVILIIFLDLRSSFLIALSIPTSFAVTLIILPLTGQDINAISLAALIIALGMIVDQSIVVSENAMKHMNMGKPKRRAVIEGTQEVVLPVVASVATTVLAFAPMFVMTGTIGRFIFVIPVVIIASLLGSIFNCFFILPNHLNHSLREPDPTQVTGRDPDDLENGEELVTWQDRFFSRVSGPYEKTLPVLLRNRYIVVAVAFALLVFSIFWAGKFVRMDLFPSDGADTFFVYVEMPDDYTFDATQKIIEEYTELIKKIPADELRYYTARLGTDNSNTLSKPVGGQEHLAYIQVTLVPFSERDRPAELILDNLRKEVRALEKEKKEKFARKRAEVKQLLRRLTNNNVRETCVNVLKRGRQGKVGTLCREIAALHIPVQTRLELAKPGPPAGTPIEMHVHADNDQERACFVGHLVADLKTIKGVTDVNTNSKLGRQEYKLDIDYEALARAGLTVQDVAGTLRIAFDGIDATSIVKNNEEIQLRVRFPIEHRQDVRNVLNLDIRNRQGYLVPIRSFAKLGRIRAETAIHHTDGDVTTSIFGQTGVTVQPRTVIEGLFKKYSSPRKLEPRPENYKSPKKVRENCGQDYADFLKENGGKGDGYYPILADFPTVSFSYGGEAEKSAESVKSLLIAFIAGIVAIYLVLTLLFDSLSQPILILIAIPFGLIGVIWAFYGHGRPFSFMGLIGVIGLSGIVVNNSLMMVEFINKLVNDRINQEGRLASREYINTVVAGSKRRLRPIIITTITTVTGLLPTAYGIGGSDPFIEPMVLSIAWGLLLSTQISLILIPSLYMVNMDIVNLGSRASGLVAEKVFAPVAAALQARRGKTSADAGAEDESDGSGETNEQDQKD